MASINKTVFNLTLNATKLFSFVIENLSELFYFILNLVLNINLQANSKLLSRANINAPLTHTMQVVLSKITMSAFIVTNNTINLFLPIFKETGKIYSALNNVNNLIGGTHAKLRAIPQSMDSNISFVSGSGILAQLHILSEYDSDDLDEIDAETLADLDATIL
jgi:hypothetical protein